MSKKPKEQKEYYADIAEKHATFLAEKVFKPAFIIAFIHGVKHGRVDMESELKINPKVGYKDGKILWLDDDKDKRKDG